MEAVQAAQKAGKIRFIGFTGHKDPLVHLRMLEVAARHDFRFDAVQMPLNVMDAHFRSFGQQVLPVLVKRADRRAGHEADGQRHHSQEQRGHARRVPALRDEPADLGRDHRHRQHGNPPAGPGGGPQLQAARRRSKWPRCLQRTAAAASEGQYEPFKTTNRFDGTAKNPQWLG